MISIIPFEAIAANRQVPTRQLAAKVIIFTELSQGITPLF